MWDGDERFDEEPKKLFQNSANQLVWYLFHNLWQDQREEVGEDEMVGL